MEPIADLYSVFPEKFGIPRQSGQAPDARAEVVLRPPFARAEAVRGLEQCSHIWLLFLCHQAEGWRPTVRPPRLGGNSRLGVFASRSPFRPNPIGLSVVRLDGLSCEQGVRLQVSGVDMVDGTPVLDIKPYLPWADAVPEASGGIAARPPERLPIRFTEAASRALAQRPDGGRTRRLIEQILALDPRPAYHDDPTRVYVNALADCSVRWCVDEGEVKVIELRFHNPDRPARAD
ncbi:tRNA (N6-threonylcarbamoyladenosine(37)-N6)-methyltransferase TrmO [Natronospira bacteriovora]|uniref:tRNA (N6-threonylcarbamoyladenosine(37)-N6)-methyltransferase TrmO n=1 Tax=Natronospira bacteriovora TaxID=3069753 RepID=A0ABU0WA10_9GAMM|nr:tRNA (N6-threonylcarbamoyladenosine(37)-N6)-methyltransferase TrmO [Natronospira sp. AB-CW4]MDQ2069795.1 tRNA (N6-threonylcarbamoyladenosine(37)-N6)-methyltransferase TrmO [Natronospira sp. AB-CW4]